MNSNRKSSIVQLKEDDLKQLVKEVKETVATDVDVNLMHEQKFSSANLWSIQRKMRPALRLKLTSRWGM